MVKMQRAEILARVVASLLVVTLFACQSGPDRSSHRPRFGLFAGVVSAANCNRGVHRVAACKKRFAPASAASGVA